MNTLSKIPVLDVSHLTVTYRTTTVLSDVSFTIEQGSMVGIIGPNGAGKSTLIKSILGLVPIMSGNITLFINQLRACAKKLRMLRSAVLLTGIFLQQYSIWY